MDEWTLLDLRFRHALRGDDDRKDEGADWISVPVGDDGTIRILAVRDPLAYLDAVEQWVVGDVEA